MINRILYRFLADALKKSTKYFDKTYRVGTLNSHLQNHLKALPAFELESSPSSDLETCLFIIEDKKQLNVLQKKIEIGRAHV